jgi:hypothetical protein
VSALVNNMYETNELKNVLPDIIDEKYMDFLGDFCNYVQQNKMPVYEQKKVEVSTNLENAIGKDLFNLFSPVNLGYLYL